jgi:hypothetical protein
MRMRLTYLVAVSAIMSARASDALAAVPAQSGAPNTWTAILDLISTTYDRAPALVLGLAMLLMLPPLALLGAMLRRAPVAEQADATMVYRRSDRQRGRLDGGASDPAPLWPTDAWIQFADGRRHDVGAGYLRLGRDADNDICLDEKTVHRYHAAIHRTDDAAYVITDLSSNGGNGVLVNGQRIEEAQLSDGDTIELGQVKLSFVARPA